MNPRKNVPSQRHGAKHLKRPGKLHKLGVAQMKVATAAQVKKQSAAPPVYRPQHAPKVLQTKLAVGQQSHQGQSPRKPVAPPVYRPQSKTVQPKMAQARPTATQPKLNAARLAAPAAYRPQNESRAVQPKMGSGAEVRMQPVAPPVYRPQPTPKVLQTKQARSGAATKPALGRTPPPSPPVYKPNDSRGVMQRLKSLNNGREVSRQRPARLPEALTGPSRVVQRQARRVANPFGARTGVVQMRGQNPYAAGGGVTSHHIIPHSTLVATLGQLTAQQKTAVLRQFLPPFDGLTLETLVNAAITDNANDPLQISYLGAVKTQYHINNDNPVGFRDIARKRFSALSVIEKQAITFDGVSFDNFQTAYNQQRGGTGGAPTEKEVGMMEAFFEWQSGNQFYGSARYEPGTSNDFDSDAKYVLGDEQYVSDLSQISKTLKASQANVNLTDQQKLDLVNTFTTLAGLGTAGKAIPALDDSQWFNLNTDEKEALLESLEGYNRVTASGGIGARDNTKKVHKDIVRQGYKKKKKSRGHKDAWHDVFTYLKNDGIGPPPATVTHPLCRAWQIEATRGKYLGIQGTSIKVLVKHGVGVKMDDIWDALDSLFDLRFKEVFDFVT